MATAPRFLCDEMLGRLARWLRAAGYDAELAERGAADRDLVDRAREEGRLLLTRDRAMRRMRGAAGRVVVLDGERPDDWAAEVAARTGLDWLRAPFTRCLVCNAPLRGAPASDWDAVPERSRRFGGPLRRCPECGRLYWQGTHARRLGRRLESLARRTPGRPETTEGTT